MVFSVGAAASEACNAPNGGEVEIGVAPLHDLHRLEIVQLKRLRQFSLERRTTAGGAEGAVAGGAPCAACDLSKLGRVQFAELITVKFAVGGK